MGERTHPYTVVANLWRVSYLAVFPLARGLMGAVGGNLSDWLRGAWFDILIFLLMLTMAILQWHMQRYFYDDEGIHLSAGLFLRRKISLRWERISSISLTSPYLLKPVQVSVLRADTIGGSYKDADIHLYLGASGAKRIVTAFKEYERPSYSTRRYQPGIGSIAALGLAGSNSLAGILFISTLLSQSGRILGREFSERVIGTFEELTRTLAGGIPAAAAALGYIAIAGWLVAFSKTVLRYIDFHIIRGERNIAVNSGRFTSRNYIVDYSHINFIDIQQTVGTKLLKRQSLYISAVGYGKHKDDIACVLPPEKETLFREYRKLFFPDFTPCPRQLKPKPRGAFRFLSGPLYLCIGIPVAIAVLMAIMPSWSDFILFAGLMSLLPSLLFLAVRILDSKSSGIGRDGNYYTISYSRGFRLHTIVVAADKIVKVELKQGLFQRFAGSCDLYIFTPAEKRTWHRCRNLWLSEAKDFFSEIA